MRVSVVDRGPTGPTLHVVECAWGVPPHATGLSGRVLRARWVPAALRGNRGALSDRDPRMRRIAARNSSSDGRRAAPRSRLGEIRAAAAAAANEGGEGLGPAAAAGVENDSLQPRLPAAEIGGGGDSDLVEWTVQ